MMIEVEEIQALCQSIGEHFEPEQIILFGSYAYGKPRSDSDIDLLVVLSHQRRNTDMAMEIRRATRPNFPVDLIVRSPEEMIWRYREYAPLIRMAVDKGKIIYDQSCYGISLSR